MAVVQKAAILVLLYLFLEAMFEVFLYSVWPSENLEISWAVNNAKESSVDPK